RAVTFCRTLRPVCPSSYARGPETASSDRAAGSLRMRGSGPAPPAAAKEEPKGGDGCGKDSERTRFRNRSNGCSKSRGSDTRQDKVAAARRKRKTRVEERGAGYRSNRRVQSVCCKRCANIIEYIDVRFEADSWDALVRKNL